MEARRLGGSRAGDDLPLSFRENKFADNCLKGWKTKAGDTSLGALSDGPGEAGTIPRVEVDSERLIDI